MFGARVVIAYDWFQMRLLLVEDDKKAARVLSRGLSEEGFVVDVANAGDVGLELASASPYDLIVLDWLLPRKDGLGVCRDLRDRGIRTPVLMLTARDSLRDRVSGLDNGADDYLTKPFAFEELLARLRALLRRSEKARTPALKVADLALDPVTHRVTRAGREVVLTPKEYAILETLMRYAGQVVSRARIGQSVWQDEPGDLANLVDVHVSRLRRKIDQGEHAMLIQTVRSRGFRLGGGGE
jgi:DNA-binding response OmpR family regulator